MAGRAVIRRAACRSSLAMALALSAVVIGCSPKDAPLQSSARPLDLALQGPVKAAGSDFWSWWFDRYTLPSLVTFADREFTHNAAADHLDKLAIDPARLNLLQTGRVRVYFVGEGSGYANGLGINLEGIGVLEGRPLILFPNVNANVPLDKCAALVNARRGRLDRSKLGKRTEEHPLLPGDFVDLGELPAGTTLNFFLAANDGHDVRVYVPIRERNPDGIVHMIASVMERSPFLLISFEDMYQGGDADYEDNVFAVQMSVDNIDALIGQFDPLRRIKQIALIAAIAGIAIGGPVGVIVGRRRARRRRLKRRYEQAEALVDSAHPGEAIKIIRETQPEITDRRNRASWARLEMRALERMEDVESLWELYGEMPGLFSERESAALAVARAQVEEGYLDAFATLRGAWRNREESPEVWLALDADTLVKQEKSLDALELLARARFDGARDCGRVARLAFLQAHDDPTEAGIRLAQAVELDPTNPDGHLFRAAFLESQGKHHEALASYRTALACAPRNRYLLDRLAEALRRGGDYPQALQVWCDGLRPPSTGLIWLKVLFWSRVTRPVAADWKTLERPPGPLRPLVDFLLELEPERFWNAKAFTPIAERQPELLSRQEVHWLRVLEALRTESEGEALSMLNLQGFRSRSWEPDLEAALLRLVIYRLRGFLGTPVSPDEAGAASAATQHPFFAEINRWMQYRPIKLPDEAKQFLRSDAVFAAACLAVGWSEAGLRLLPAWRVPPGSPEWLAQDIVAAARRNRGEAAARSLVEGPPGQCS